MGRRKATQTQDFEDQTPLSETQNTAITGRKEDEDGHPDVQQAPAKTIEITAASLVDQMFCNYKYKRRVAPATFDKVAIKSEVPVHPDLVKCFRRLDTHLAVICEEVSALAIDDIEDIGSEELREKVSKFLATDVVINNSGEVYVLVIKGTKELSTKDCITLETPKVVVDNDYPFAQELTDTIIDLISEVELYMRGEKQAEASQLEMEFEGADNAPYVEEDL